MTSKSSTTRSSTSHPITRRPDTPNSRIARILAASFLLAMAGLAPAAAEVIQTGHSALWHNLERGGEGWMLEILDEESANVYWYTYDDHGNQRWLTG